MYFFFLPQKICLYRQLASVRASLAARDAQWGEEKARLAEETKHLRGQIAKLEESLCRDQDHRITAFRNHCSDQQREVGLFRSFC